MFRGEIRAFLAFWSLSGVDMVGEGKWGSSLLGHIVLRRRM